MKHGHKYTPEQVAHRYLARNAVSRLVDHARVPSCIRLHCGFVDIPYWIVPSDTTAIFKSIAMVIARDLHWYTLTFVQIDLQFYRTWKIGVF